MSRKLRSLAALVTVALIGAGGTYGFAADGKTGKTRLSSSPAPGTLLPTGSSRSTARSTAVSSPAPGTLPPMASSRSTVVSSPAPGTLPPMGSS